MFLYIEYFISYLNINGKEIKKRGDIIKGKLFVIEGKRLIPILFLLVLLISLSIYDNFRVDTVDPVADVKDDSIVEFTTTDQGKMKVTPTIKLADKQDDWNKIAKEFKLELPDYPFNPHGEVGIFVLNGKMKKIELLPQADKQVQVRVSVDVKDNYYHLGTVNKRDYWEEGKEYLWVLTDSKGQVFEEIVLEREEEVEEEEEEIEEVEEREEEVTAESNAGK